MKGIPIDRLDKKSLEFSVRQFGMGEQPSSDEQIGLHRDDHYIFFLFAQGTAHMMIDFQEVSFQAQQAYYILPGQVHTRIDNQKASGWFLAVSTQLIPAGQRSIFEESLALQQPITLLSESFDQCQTLLSIITQRAQASLQSGDTEVLRSLLHSFTGILAAAYQHLDEKGLKVGRQNQLTCQFKELLRERFKEIKSPSAYANLLNVSENYLNEAVRNHTGFAISYWIKNELILEAKRLLYYTSLDAKEIAHSLGFEDHTYFFKLFKKEVGATPLSFRKKKP